ncbi:trypsin-like serine protease [Streptomyces sp. AM6-12]|uniref:trypsin-like serine protease n=1 Tax=Streptomyces sp. AM6-12 TaxID=3345149 RepID=UPI003799E571
MLRSRYRWVPALTLGLCAGIPGAVPASAAPGTALPAASEPHPPALQAAHAPAPSASSAAAPSNTPDLGAEEKYWTAGRMADAVPFGAPSGPAAPRRGARAQGAAGHASPPPGTPQPQHFGGHPMIGTFFFDGKPLGGNTYCTGSVVHTAAKDIVLTAGHCGIGLSKATHRVFVPQYRSGKAAAQQPFGVFPVLQVYTDPRYTANTKSAASDLDLAFAQVDANNHGKVEDVTGALTFTPTSGYRHKVTVIGYPGSGSVNPGHTPIRCPVSTSQLPGFRQLRMTCKGFYGGVSGGPWIEGYDSATGKGNVIGSTGGYNGGGNDANDDWVTYAPVYGKDAEDLFQQAATHQQLGQKPPYTGTTDPRLPGPASTWKNARLTASGDFRGTGHSDLLVVWTDGEVSLYPGNGHGGYDAERQLLPPNSTWKNAKAITAGDFTGTDRFDLLVRWTDGEVTLYGDVGTKGLKWAGTRMIKPNATWKNATQISAGRFGGSRYVTDLIVRWADGSLTLYTNVGAGTFGQQHKLKAPNGTWKNATLLTSGEFSGSQKWDLMVRWTDGELDNYAGTGTSGLGAERRIQNPNGRWAQVATMTTGDFTENGRTDDLVIRRSDGETTLYTDTPANTLGTEHVLVASTS